MRIGATLLATALMLSPIVDPYSFHFPLLVTKGTVRQASSIYHRIILGFFLDRFPQSCVFFLLCQGGSSIFLFGFWENDLTKALGNGRNNSTRLGVSPPQHRQILSFVTGCFALLLLFIFPYFGFLVLGR